MDTPDIKATPGIIHRMKTNKKLQYRKLKT